VLGASAIPRRAVAAADRHPRSRSAAHAIARRPAHGRRLFRSSRPMRAALVSLEASTGRRPAYLSSARCRMRPPEVIKELLTKAPNACDRPLPRLSPADPAAYARWYGHEHHAPEPAEARRSTGSRSLSAAIARRLVANPGCYTTARSSAHSTVAGGSDRSRRDRHRCKSGHTGEGVPPRRNAVSEVSEGFHAYRRRHHGTCRA